MADEISFRDLGYSNLLSKSSLEINALADLPEGVAYNGTTDLVTNAVAPSDFLSGEFVQHLINAKDGYIRSADCLAYNDGTGYFLGWDPTLEEYVFFIGNSAGNKLTWDGTTLAVSGAFSAGTIDIGGSDATSFHVDVDGNLWLGAATFATAPFTVSNAGALTATGVTLTGAITATSGAIGGWIVTTSDIKDAAGVVGMSSTVTAGDDIRFFAGNVTPASAPFYVTETGALVASSATVTGVVTANTGYIGGVTGWVIATGKITSTGIGLATAAGDATYAFWAGNDTPASAEFSVTHAGALVATSATITGSITATTGTIGGFSIGSDYIRDAADSFGLASTVAVGDDVRFWAGATFANRATAPARITEAGAATFTSISITGGVIDGTSTIGGRDASDLAAAIDASANLVTDLINVRLDTSAKTMLSDFSFGAADYAGALKSGTITWNTTTGAITGGSGVLVYRGGIIGAATGVATFTIDAATGAATFAGALSAPTGNIGGWTIGTSSLSDAAGVVGISSLVTGGDDIRFWAGDATPASAEFRVYESGALVASSATITGAITATSGAIGGWTVAAATITDAAGVVGLSSTVTGGDDIRIWAGNATPASAPFYVTEAGVLVASSATISGSVTATSGTIGGFSISSTTISATNLVLTSGIANTANIAVGTGSNLAGINSANSGTDIVFWAGDTFANRATAPFTVTAAGVVTGTTVNATGQLSNVTTFTAGEALASGDHVGITSADTVKRFSPTALPTTYDFTSVLAATANSASAGLSRAGFCISLTASLKALVYLTNNAGTPSAGGILVPVTAGTGAIGTMDFDASFGVGVSSPSNIDTVAVSSSRILVSASKTNDFRANVNTFTTTIANGTPVTIDSSDVSEGFCEYISDSHVLFFSHITSSGNIQFHKYTLATATLTSSSSGTVTTSFAGDTFMLKGVRRFLGTNYFLLIVQNDTDATAQAQIVHYDTTGSTFDVVGSVVNFPSSADLSNNNYDQACFADLSATQMIVFCPTSTTAGVIFLVTSDGVTTPTIGTQNAVTAFAATAGYTLSKINSRAAFLNTMSSTTITSTIYEMNSAATDVVSRVVLTTTGLPNNAVAPQTDSVTFSFQPNPTRYALVGIETASNDVNAGTGLYTLPPSAGLTRASAAISASVAVSVGGYNGTITGLAAATKYYADIAGLLTSDSTGSPDKVGVSKDTNEILVKSW